MSAAQGERGAPASGAPVSAAQGCRSTVDRDHAGGPPPVHGTDSPDRPGADQTGGVDLARLGSRPADRPWRWRRRARARVAGDGNRRRRRRRKKEREGNRGERTPHRGWPARRKTTANGDGEPQEDDGNRRTGFGSSPECEGMRVPATDLDGGGADGVEFGLANPTEATALTAASGSTARERWGARGRAGFRRPTWGVGEEREAGFENRIPAISGAGTGGREGKWAREVRRMRGCGRRGPEEAEAWARRRLRARRRGREVGDRSDR
uniref:Plant disease resistance polyprotein-like n=1 Tax=Oryza sativa subsp. indica TaxID=39946 RepID=C8TF26_ORYSI|nr:plant disease resistance polyprotein-like [Oryza sativa Indica Group]